MDEKKSGRGHTHLGHAHEGDDSSKAFVFAIILNGLITAVEIAGGIISGSLALLSDSMHNFGDTASLLLSLIAMKVSGKSRNPKKSFGYKRAEVLAAFVNASALLFISAMLIVEAYRRFISPVEIKSGVMIVVAVIGFFANLLSVLILMRRSRESMNIRSSYLHLLGDTLSSVGVIAGGIAIKIWGAYWIDPLVTVIVSLYIIKETWEILKRAADILMQSSVDIDYEQVKDQIEGIDGVRNIHHVHTWMSNESTFYFEAHVELDDMPVSESCGILKRIEHLLRENYGISHTTIQFETNVCSDKTLFGEEHSESQN